MTDINLTLGQILKRLRGSLVLVSSMYEENEKHKVETWLAIIPWEDLKKEASLESDIYNKGRFSISVLPDYQPGYAWFGFFTAFEEVAVTEFRKKF